jgi:hypothetical protein
MGPDAVLRMNGRFAPIAADRKSDVIDVCFSPAEMRRIADFRTGRN